MKNAFFPVFFCSLLGGLIGFVISTSTSCTPQESRDAKTAASLAVRVADDVCDEVQDAGGSPDWVTLLCKGVDTLDKVRVLLPRTEWHTIRARKVSVDAGPGK